MKDERKTKKELIGELTDLRGRVAELETYTGEQALEAKPVADLIRIMQFTEQVSSKVHGLLDRLSGSRERPAFRRWIRIADVRRQHRRVGGRQETAVERKEKRAESGPPVAY